MLSHAHQSLESAHAASAAPVTPSFLQQFMTWMTNAAGDLGTLVAAKTETPEPKVFQIRSQSGELFWHIYDPTTGCSLYCSSEEEALQYFDRSDWM